MHINNHPVADMTRRGRKQPVAAVELLFLRIAADIQRNTLTSVCLLGLGVLRMQATYPHRLIHARQPQRITDIHFTAERGSRHHQARAFYRKCPVNRQAKTLRNRMRLRLQFADVLA